MRNKMKMKGTIKKIIGFFIGRCLFKICRFLNKNRLTVIYYHRIVEKGALFDSSYANMCVNKYSFEAQMQLLREFYNPVGEETIVAAMQKDERLPRNPVWITFDDGYRDNFDNAYPILKKYNIPATFFVATDFINKRIIPLEAGIVEAEVGDIFMDWKEIKEMSDDGFSIGGHTKSHRILSSLTKEDIVGEISVSREEIEKRIGRKVITFAYPKGKIRDCNLDVSVPVLKELGFILAVTTAGGNNSWDKYGNRLKLKRIGFSPNDTLDFFKFKVATGSFWQK